MEYFRTQRTFCVLCLWRQSVRPWFLNRQKLKRAIISRSVPPSDRSAEPQQHNSRKTAPRELQPGIPANRVFKGGRPDRVQVAKSRFSYHNQWTKLIATAG